MKYPVAAILLLPGLASAQSGLVTVRIGSNEQQPLAFHTKDRGPDGFFVAALREAGRRAGYDVRWHIRKDSVAQAVASGEIDVWAAAVVTPDRKNVLHMTPPWWSDGFSLVVRGESGIQQDKDLKGLRLMVHRGPPLPRAESDIFPGVNIEHQAFHVDALRAVCSGQVDAALLTALHFRSLLLERPAACEGIPLRVVPHTLGTLDLAMAASFPNRKLADSIRQQITGMMQDGTLQRIAARYAGVEGSVPWSYAPPAISLPKALAALAALMAPIIAFVCWRLARERRTVQLAHANALRAARAKEEFLATVSHEIRTPMNAVLGYLDLLEGTQLNSEQKDLAEDISRSTSSLLTLLSNILDFSKIRGGNVSLRLDALDVVSLVQDVASASVLMAEAKDLEFSVFIDPRSPRMLRGDASRIRQVMLNLTANAVKFTSAGYVKLDVGYRDGVLAIVVQDTGTGIAAEKHELIFEPFSQVDSTDTRRHGGLGLGLAIVRDLVRMMDGTIEVDSRIGIGSRFTVRLPLPAESGDGWLQALDGERIVQAALLVRESANVAVLREYLRSAGVETHEFRNEEDAADWLRTQAGASDNKMLVFADPRLLAVPELFAQDVRGTRWRHGLKLVLVGSMSMMRLLSQRAKEPFHGTLEWPISISSLMQLLNPPKATPALPAPPMLHLQAPVLVVDDNPINRKVASALLRKLGCEVDVAEDGEAAADMCRRTQYSLVLMDCQMPVMDGYASANLIRSQEGISRRVRIIGLSASTEPETRTRCIEAGMDGYIPKPVTTDTLRKLLSGTPEARR